VKDALAMNVAPSFSPNTLPTANREFNNINLNKTSFLELFYSTPISIIFCHFKQQHILITKCQQHIAKRNNFCCSNCMHSFASATGQRSDHK
jgi:hypothetical protein